VALRTTGIKNVKFKIIKIRTNCRYVGYFYYSENLNWAAQNPRLGRMQAHGLDIAELNKVGTLACRYFEGIETQVTIERKSWQNMSQRVTPFCSIAMKPLAEKKIENFYWSLLLIREAFGFLCTNTNDRLRSHAQKLPSQFVTGECFLVFVWIECFIFIDSSLLR